MLSTAGGNISDNESDSIYSAPRVYDLAFSYRNYEREVSELMAWHRDVSRGGRPPESVLELACGPGRHMLEFARAGIRGWGVDISEAMCAYANALAANEQLDVRAEPGDMTGFELGTRFDLVLLMLNSLSHILDGDSLHSHFFGVRKHLNDHGIYVIESSRPESTESTTEHSWTSSDKHGNVSVNWRCERDFEHARISGSVDGAAVELHADFPVRRWSTEDLVLIGREAGLTVVGCSAGFAAADPTGALAGTTTLAGGSGLHPCIAFAKSGRH